MRSCSGSPARRRSRSPWSGSRRQLVPMAYCRYGCPTGGMLDYLRCGRIDGHATCLRLGCCCAAGAVRAGAESVTLPVGSG